MTASQWLMAEAPFTLELKLAILGSLRLGVHSLSSKAQTIENLINPQVLKLFIAWSLNFKHSIIIWASVKWQYTMWGVKGRNPDTKQMSIHDLKPKESWKHVDLGPTNWELKLSTFISDLHREKQFDEKIFVAQALQSLAMSNIYCDETCYLLPIAGGRRSYHNKIANPFNLPGTLRIAYHAIPGICSKLERKKNSSDVATGMNYDVG